MMWPRPTFGAGHVEAIEIDRAILLTGKVSHPEKPYSDPRVHSVINRAPFLSTEHGATL